MPFQFRQKRRGKSVIALHELRRILRTVDAGKVKDKIALLAPFPKQGRIGVNIVLIHFYVRIDAEGAILALRNIFQRRAQITAKEALCSGN